MLGSKQSSWTKSENKFKVRQLGKINSFVPMFVAQNA